MENKIIKPYISRLLKVAVEKSELGFEKEALYYFRKAFKIALNEDLCKMVFAGIASSSLPDKDYYSYYTLYKTLHLSSKPVNYLLSMLKDKELANEVNRLLSIHPGPLFHYLLERVEDLEEKYMLACIFLPVNHYIYGPDPSSVLDQVINRLNNPEILKEAC